MLEINLEPKNLTNQIETGENGVPKTYDPLKLNSLIQEIFNSPMTVVCI